MFVKRVLVGAVLAALCSGCATGLNSHQKVEYTRYEAKGLLVEEKNPGTGAALGLLPGGGSFYGREYGFGVINLLLWPLSILWDPVSGYDAAKSINYQATRASIEAKEEKELNALDDQLKTGQIDVAAYTLEKRKIDRKYGTD
ncbi:hypothetical protein SAMN05216189_103936 [Pseudomonas delhiensis]|uniref:TM2 domain-containing protein n=1 Tax=Pseudomonas delhiensis TaxID=366289 RepID=A0A239N1H3_9PSED|nr:hypothetical protein [Pseudomonas delhiensis]SDK47477.1 hypothetical protein SAMN05216189_103936 [Pseudomonas delhiensis]SNT48806.1 hypothetical protein SAMN06295949_13519 [Pseudomonas delhiensis]